MFEELIQNLCIKTKKHPKPYKLTWLQKRSEVIVSKQVLISLSIGNNYKNQFGVMWQPWMHSTYSLGDHGNMIDWFIMMAKIILIVSYFNKKIILLHIKESISCQLGANLSSLLKFKEEMEEFSMVFILFGKQMSSKITIPNVVKPLVEEFFDAFHANLWKELPPLQNIQIDVLPLPNKICIHGKGKDFTRCSWAFDGEFFPP